ncbi:hypothetical protein FQA39_LY14472 [Lamprigera yunnana]|nr:hypothetical protein FQA39_LY14472 [Lamprigera yunnana]
MSITFKNVKYIITSNIFLMFIYLIFFHKFHNNVCTTFSDYYTNRDQNNNCYYNPDSKLNVTEIIKRWQYSVEEYHLTTTDGYILTVFRIPFGKNLGVGATRKPVLLQHGMFANSAGFINRGNKSLAFILADAGFDVWLGNFRGTLYSKRHKEFSPTERKFWDFDTRELALYDTPAIVDFIFNKTEQQLLYIGHSFGSAAAAMYGTIFPNSAKQKLKIIIAFAPSIHGNQSNIVLNFFLLFWRYTKSLLYMLTNGELYLKGHPNSSIREILCTGYPFQMYLCQFLEMSVNGFSYSHSDPKTLPITIVQNVDLSSHRTLDHIIQCLEKRNWDYYDYGAESNQLIYRTPYPPYYNLTLLRVPMLLVRAKNDLLITKKEIEDIRKALSKESNLYDIFTIDSESFNHDDFIVARDVVPLLYEPIVNFIKKI